MTRSRWYQGGRITTTGYVSLLPMSDDERKTFDDERHPIGFQPEEPDLINEPLTANQLRRRATEALPPIRKIASWVPIDKWIEQNREESDG